jgi:hypothetical protein
MFYRNVLLSELEYMSEHKCTILKMHDRAESHRVNKEVTFDLPMRLLIIGKSLLSGKSNAVGNLTLRPFDNTDIEGQQFYRNDFKGENIFIVCPSTNVDQKWESIIEGKQIPGENIYNSYDEIELTNLYNKIVKQWHDAEDSEGKIKHEQVLIVFDDMSFGGDLKSKINGVMARFACNSRHYFVSIIITAQKFTDVSTTMRENASGFMLFNCSYKQKELIYNDVGEMPKKEFMTMFNKATFEKHSFMVVNYTNPPDRRFLDQHFQPIA